MQHWRNGHNVVASQEDLKQAALALLCFSLPPELVDLLLDHDKLLLLLTYGGNGPQLMETEHGVYPMVLSPYDATTSSFVCTNHVACFWNVPHV